MCRLALMLAAAAAIALLAFSADMASAQLPANCAGKVQTCPSGKEMFCNRWKSCRGKRAKVPKYCDAPVCMTKKG